MTQNQIRPEEMAVRQEAREEEARRESRRKALETQEIQRRETEAREAEAEERREAASQKAGELAEKRAELEASLEAKMAEMNASLEDLKALDSEHRRELHSAGELTGAGKYQTLSSSVSSWIKEGLLSGSGNPKRRSLAMADPLTPTLDTTARKPDPGLGGSELRDAPRREENRFLATLHQRSVQLRRQYARDLAFGELVSPDEKDAVGRLSEEQREQVQRFLTGETRDES